MDESTLRKGILEIIESSLLQGNKNINDFSNKLKKKNIINNRENRLNKINRNNIKRKTNIFFTACTIRT